MWQGRMHTLKLASNGSWVVTALCLSALGPNVSRANEVRDATAEQGAATVVQVCTGCHGLKYVDFDDLLQLGLSEQQVDEWRGVTPRTAPIERQMPPEAAKASFGVVPPDLSLMAIARDGGTDYIYRMLTGFYLADDGTLQNRAFPGIRMPDVLGISSAADAQAIAQIEKTARDAAAFLHWAADPSADYRFRLGLFVIGYLLLFTVVMYLFKRLIWKGVT